jgi:hypothetical protein
MTVKEFHKMENSKTQQAVEGWITEPLVAQQEGIINYNTDETQRALLDEILAGLPSRPHERPDLAAKGWKQYEYSSKLLNTSASLYMLKQHPIEVILIHRN